MKYEVKLRVVINSSDIYNESGFLGLQPAATYGENYGREAFQPFWSPEGIYHDIFQHWFEDMLKPFKGNGFMSMYGEMAASAIHLYEQTIGFESFMLRKSQWSVNYNGVADTIDTIEDYIADEENFLEHLLSSFCVNKRLKVDYNYALSSAINEYYYRLEEMGVRHSRPKRAIQKLKTTVSKAYMYGWRLAEKMWSVRHNADNMQPLNIRLEEILRELAEFTKREITEYYMPTDYEWKYLVAKVNTNSNRILRLYAEDAVRNRVDYKDLIIY